MGRVRWTPGPKERELRAFLAALELAHILAGETPGCPVDAKVAVAQVFANRQQAQIVGGWFGWDDPTVTDLAVALTWQAWPDLTAGALYAVGPGDADKMPWLNRPTGHWDCGGTTITTWTD